jgi:integrase
MIGTAEAGPRNCRRCGARPAQPGRWSCVDCRLAARIERLLDDGTGRINPALLPLAAVLRAGPTPMSRLAWLQRPHVRHLLTDLATGRMALTHEALHAYPHHRSVIWLRHLLIASGVLPAVDKHLLTHESWLHRRLTLLADHPYERLLRQFGLWHQMPRLRATAATRPLRPTAAHYARGQFTQAEAFLTWLHERGRPTAELTQADIDSWYATQRAHVRQASAGFLTWAMTHGHLPRLALPRIRYRQGEAITQTRRLALLRRYLRDERTPLCTRTIACFLLLYAQPLSRILHLTLDDITQDEVGQMTLRLGDPPSPVPEPFADLLHQLTADREHHAAAGHAGRWLFPGRQPGQPLAYRTVHTRLRDLGFPTRTARISALRELVLQAPAPVIAQALGFHHTTTHRQAVNAGTTWARYTRPGGPT